MKLWLLTINDAGLGDEWAVLGIYSTRALADKARERFQASRKRPDGTLYPTTCTIEEWVVDKDAW